MTAICYNIHENPVLSQRAWCGTLGLYLSNQDWKRAFTCFQLFWRCRKLTAIKSRTNSLSAKDWPKRGRPHPHPLKKISVSRFNSYHLHQSIVHREHAIAALNTRLLPCGDAKGKSGHFWIQRSNHFQPLKPIGYRGESSSEDLRFATRLVLASLKGFGEWARRRGK